MKPPKKSWGGKREGAGRPATSPFVSHVSRPEFEGKRLPMLITLRLRSGLPSLQLKHFYETFERAALRARRFGLRVIHFKLLPKSILMICEFHEREQLERSFKSLNTTMAIAMKRALKEKNEAEHRGPIFLGRFKMELLHSPERLKGAMSTVLKGENPAYSSAPLFTLWNKLLEGDPKPELSSADLEKPRRITALPQFWLTKVGWTKA